MFSLIASSLHHSRLKIERWLSLLLWLLAAGAVVGAPSVHCLWTPPWLPKPAVPGTASIQYLLLSGSQIMDDQTAALIAQSLGPDRTLHFQYEKDWPDDHVFPNGITMGQIHQWLTSMINAWNQEPLMPLQLSLERGNPGTRNVIRLDDTSSETSANSGVGSASWRSDGTTVTYTCRAVLNVGPGSLNTRELMEFLGKHELGHCLSLAHTSNRAASMGYQSNNVDYWARVNHFAFEICWGSVPSGPALPPGLARWRATSSTRMARPLAARMSSRWMIRPGKCWRAT